MAGGMITFDNLVDDVLLTLRGYGLSQPRSAKLAGALTDTDTTIKLTAVDGFEQGIAEIGDELVFINSVDYSAFALDVDRAQYDTVASAHDNAARITMAPTWTRKQVADAINDAIVGTYPDLFGVASTSFAFSPVQTTYPLPAEAERILSVVTDTIGPSQEQLAINRYSFNSVAPTVEFATGNTITLEKGGFPGRDITVTYTKAPSEITFGASFTDCGLRESAKLAIKYATCAALTAFMDTAQLPVDSAAADNYDPSHYGPGTASKISNNLYQRYQIELKNEQRRLRQATGVPISVRTR